MDEVKKNLIIAITGASGALYAKILLDNLKLLNQQINKIALVLSDNAKYIWHEEIGEYSYKNYSYNTYEAKDFSAPFASGSSDFDTMIICPCSMGTLGRIAHGISNDLITRAADVILKEKRKLILVTRETPLSLIHINNMKIIAETGGIILPASPSFYSNPNTINELLKTVINRVLTIAGFSINQYQWGEKK
jgi:4-hydroxy-3-polyprenylbenzoate decarboxylase